MAGVRSERAGSRFPHAAGLENILPHHAFDGFIGLAIVFGIRLLVVFDEYFSVYGEIDQLADGHVLIDLYRLFDRYFEGPVAAETYISLAGRRVNIDAQPSRG